MGCHILPRREFLTAGGDVEDRLTSGESKPKLSGRETYPDNWKQSRHARQSLKCAGSQERTDKAQSQPRRTRRTDADVQAREFEMDPNWCLQINGCRNCSYRTTRAEGSKSRLDERDGEVGRGRENWEQDRKIGGKAGRQRRRRRRRRPTTSS